MKRGWALFALSAGLLLASATGARAQRSVFVGGGAIVPVGGFADVARAGYMGFGGAMFGLGGSRFTLGGEGVFGRSSHALRGDRSDLYGGFALAGYTPRIPYSAHVTVLGGAGAMVHSHESRTFSGLAASRSGLAIRAGVDVAVPIGGVLAFLRGTYTKGLDDLDTRAFPTELLAIGGGVMIPLGGVANGG